MRPGLVSSEGFTMISSRRALAAASLILLTGITVSCDSGGGDKMLGNGALAVLEPGVNLSATPATIILDPNDPNAPRDPVTQKLIGSTNLAALRTGRRAAARVRRRGDVHLHGGYARVHRAAGDHRRSRPGPGQAHGGGGRAQSRSP